MSLVAKTADVALVAATAPPRARLPHALRRVALSEVERSAATGLVAGDAEAIAELAQDRATAYASGDAGVRRRALSRAAAVQEAQVQQLAVLLAEAVTRRDERGVRLLDRTLSSATARYRALLDQLRIEFAATRKVTMSAVGPVTLVAEESR